MERQFRERGCVAACRSLYKRCYTRHLEGAGAGEAMCAEWLRFEREEGSAAEYAAASVKVP